MCQIVEMHMHLKTIEIDRLTDLPIACISGSKIFLSRMKQVGPTPESNSILKYFFGKKDFGSKTKLSQKKLGSNF